MIPIVCCVCRNSVQDCVSWYSEDHRALNIDFLCHGEIDTISIDQQVLQVHDYMFHLIPRKAFELSAMRRAMVIDHDRGDEDDGAGDWP